MKGDYKEFWRNLKYLTVVGEQGGIRWSVCEHLGYLYNTNQGMRNLTKIAFSYLLNYRMLRKEILMVLESSEKTLL